MGLGQLLAHLLRVGLGLGSGLRLGFGQLLAHLPLPLALPLQPNHLVRVKGRVRVRVS